MEPPDVRDSPGGKLAGGIDHDKKPCPPEACSGTGPYDAPVRPAGSEVVVIVSCGLTTSVKSRDCEAVPGEVLDAVALNVYVPAAALIVPVMVPFESKLRPFGRPVPGLCEIDHTYGGYPPEAANSKLYARFVAPRGRRGFVRISMGRSAKVSGRSLGDEDDCAPEGFLAITRKVRG
jgi:hypothetical protein